MMRAIEDKSAFSITKDIINGAWGIGKEVYKGAKDTISDIIEEETLNRAKKRLNRDNLTIEELVEQHYSVYKEEKEDVVKDAKDIGLKGGLLALGLGWLI